MRHLKLFSSTLLLLCCATTQATSLPTCPSASAIKAVSLNYALLYEASTHLWELLSEPFSYDNVTWNITYGINLPTAKTPSQALEQAQPLYHDANIDFSHPEAIPIPNHVICTYTSESAPYWIQALSPPGS